ncbi:MAG: alanine--tRNA ligase, partial [Clostridia bacterium]|nr:alanine--tRNA ligase [Clostridia bacterium]
SNIDRGYVLRRLIRRMTRHLNKLQIDLNELPTLIELYVETLKELYPDLVEKKEVIKEVIVTEKDKFMKTLTNGEREFNKAVAKVKQENKTVIDGHTIFKLYETYGFPPEVTSDLAKEQGFEIEMAEFDRLFKEHQEKSRQGSAQKFKGGLAEQNEQTTKYHTATHLLNAALKVVVSKDIHQKGSNITIERMRFDFSCDHKLTDEEKQKVEDLVNEWIKQDLPVTIETMKKEEAVQSGAECMFIEKYPDEVTVYTIGTVSKEICGGPHVTHTGELGHFIIKKEEASSAGVRRIKAVLSD